tara:strand:- start:287 stop:625 length:339 start_codon:yes stop_codon:yes gene_type:complete
MKYCQGTKCHTYDTQDRKKGVKGSKTNQTRKRSNFSYGKGNFCSLNCQDDWFDTHGNNAVNYFGRLEHPIVLTEANAWKRIWNRRHWNNDNEPEYIEHNMITKEERPTSEGN